MQYMGGKARIAKQLSEIMIPLCAGRTAYLEPFVGAGWVFEKMAPHFRWTAAGDTQPDLILMWQAIQDGWVPPDTISREEYRALRDAEPSALRAFVGFGCSFGGKWFGGYAENKVFGGTPGHGNRRTYDYCGASARGLARRQAAFTGTRIRLQSYSDWTWSPNNSPVIYCDPPYAGTTGYTDSWDPELFWKTMDSWSDSGALVFVSEYTAPDHWQCIWEKTTKVSLDKTTNVTTATERLFTREQTA